MIGLILEGGGMRARGFVAGALMALMEAMAAKGG